jgi:CubicO group peptidase (beta-lactamase class C family)
MTRQRNSVSRLTAGISAGLVVSLVTAGVAHAQGATADPSVVLAALAHGLRPTVLEAGEASPRWSLAERMAFHHVPGVAIAVLKEGRVVQAVGFGVREAGTHEAVDGDTLFSVGSISKVITAATALRLVAQGRLELDRDVESYLESWHLPPAPGIANPTVTLRQLMSHTAGLSVHGFPDYLPGEALPTLVESLNGAPPAQNGPVRLLRPPGQWSDYSGGGTTVEQMVIEDLTGTPLETVARHLVFEPLGMARSTFESPLSAARGNIAKAHDGAGKPAAGPRGWQAFPQEGAAGLWTSAQELGTFVGALIQAYQGRSDYLPRALALEMMTEVSPSWHGLGPRLDGAGPTRVFHHGGTNDSYRAWIEGYLETGDGFVILTNGEGGGLLRGEIRNALSDAIGRGVNPPIQSVALAPGSVRLADYAGTYRADPAIPVDFRRALTDLFDIEELEIAVHDGALSVSIPDETGSLLPLTPTRFVAPTVFGTQYEFHRDPWGVVRAVTVELGAGRAYFVREEPKRARPDTAAETRQIEAVLEAFRTAILDKDKERFLDLFLPGGTTWQAVKGDETLARIRPRQPDAVKVRLKPESNYRSFIERIVADPERTEEKFSNPRIETDGDIAVVTFDYSFHSGERELNRGKEAWQLVRTGEGWKILSVIWSEK